MDYGYRVLHIADPHFSNCHFVGTPSEVGWRHAKEVHDVLEQHPALYRPFDVLVLSGDFTFACCPEGFEAAECFVKHMAQFQIRGGVPLIRRILAIPGNHDIDLSQQVTIGQLSLPTPKAEAEARFRSFLASIQQYIGDVNHWLSAVIRVSRRGKRGLVIVGLNSCRAERWDAQGWGYVGMDQIYEVGSSLSGSDGQALAQDGDIVLAVTHHNPLPIWDLSLETLNQLPEKRKFSFVMDAGAMLNFLSDMGISVLLHGHTHIQSVKTVEGYGSDPTLSHDSTLKEPTLVLGAGSSGLKAHTTDIYPPPHHIQLMEIKFTEDKPGLPLQLPRLIYQDLSALFHRCGTKRMWKVGPRIERQLVTSWSGYRVQRVLKDKDKVRESNKAQRDSQLIETWTKLRIKKLKPLDWPQALADLHGSVCMFNNSATLSEVSQAVEQLFITPPTEQDLSGLALEQYLLKYLKQLSSWSVLRTRQSDSSAWPEVLQKLHQRILAGGSLATLDEVAQAVDQFLVTPPTVQDVCECTLEEYLSRNLKQLSSWSVLRSRESAPAAWPGVLQKLHQRILARRSSATPDEVAQAVEQLLVTLPTLQEVCKCTLEEYLIRYMK